MDVACPALLSPPLATLGEASYNDEGMSNSTYLGAERFHCMLALNCAKESFHQGDVRFRIHSRDILALDLENVFT